MRPPLSRDGGPGRSSDGGVGPSGFGAASGQSRATPPTRRAPAHRAPAAQTKAPGDDVRGPARKSSAGSRAGKTGSGRGTFLPGVYRGGPGRGRENKRWVSGGETPRMRGGGLVRPQWFAGPGQAAGAPAAGGN